MQTLAMTTGAIRNQSIDGVARSFLGGAKTPKPIHDALQNLLTKTVTDKKSVNYRKRIVDSILVSQNERFEVIDGAHLAIHNMMLLLPIIGTAGTKKTFQFKLSQTSTPVDAAAQKKFSAAFLAELNKEYFKLYLAGANDEVLYQIQQIIIDSGFDIFSQKLPNPFLDENGEPASDLGVVCHLFGKTEHDWFSSFLAFRQAQACYDKKQLHEAIALATEILESTPIHLVPVAESLARWQEQLRQGQALKALLAMDD